MIQFDITQLTDAGRRLASELSADFLGLADDPVVRAAGPIRFELTVEPAGSDLVVRGWAETTLKFDCSRCNKLFSTKVRVSSFLRTYEWAEQAAWLDVSADVREDLLLEIPGFPLCQADCQGLCGRCGTDLNVRECDCSPATDGLSPWSALDELTMQPAPPSRADTSRAGSRKRKV